MKDAEKCSRVELYRACTYGTSKLYVLDRVHSPISGRFVRFVKFGVFHEGKPTSMLWLKVLLSCKSSFNLGAFLTCFKQEF